MEDPAEVVVEVVEAVAEAVIFGANRVEKAKMMSAS